MRMRSLFQTKPFKMLLDAPEPETLGATENKSETNKNIISNQQTISQTKNIIRN